MANYIKSTDFAVKDGLTTGDPNKIIKGTEINTELNDISTAIASKADTNSPVFTGNPTAPTQSVGNNSTRIATTAFIEATLNAVQGNVNITGGDIDDVDITGGTITGLVTDLAVADGGTGKSTLALNNVILGNDTSAVQEVAPGTSGNVLTSNGTTWQSTAPAPVIGTGQTWQDVLSSRAANTTYTNTTSRPIFISVGGSGAPSNGTMSMTIDGVVIGRQGFQSIASGTSNATMSAIVPVNSTYRVDNISGWSLGFWAELR
jgi:hypothetical protein